MYCFFTDANLPETTLSVVSSSTFPKFDIKLVAHKIEVNPEDTANDDNNEEIEIEEEDDSDDENVEAGDYFNSFVLQNVQELWGQDITDEQVQATSTEKYKKI